MRSTEETELLAAMDRNLVAVYRADIEATPGGRVTDAPGVVMFRTPHGTLATNMAIVTGPIAAGTILELTRRAYAPNGQFAVWTREHADEALAAELPAFGFHQIHREPGMVFLPGAGTPAESPSDVTIRPVTDEAGRAAYSGIMIEAFGIYGAPPDSTAEHFATLAGVVGPTTQAFLAYKDERAVAGAMLYMAHEVAGIGWVGTLPDEFGHGYGPAVTWAVIAEGFRRGARFINLQASPMGERVYRRMGFITPPHYRWWFLTSE